MDTRHLAFDGYLYTHPTPGDDPGSVRFQLVTSYTDDAADDRLWSCVTGDRDIAYALITETQPGDLLRVCGTVTRSDGSGESAQFTVKALEILATAPPRVAHSMALVRYGPYAMVFDADTESVPVFTEAGTWVGTAVSSDAINDLIDAHENGDLD
ncbi:hypothetical protein ACIP79_31695 [Streptomyces sp. NPDC088747]|uniref:hypothetical protein n=1 Tax=Streptomyces sp. NPDC088747 TaxID=3365886 RepID=UPI00381C6A7E